ncbi:MAG: hypothetical protein ACLQMT_12840 [Candidatus Acidiferrales bacterium]
MLSSVMMALAFPSGLAGAVAGLIVAGVIVLLAILWYVREGRNSALEDILAQSEFGSPDGFQGTLSVAEYQPKTYLRLSEGSTASRRLKFYYRWVVGKGRQAVFNEVTFDGFRHLVQLKRKDEYTETAFAEFSALRMREVAAGRGGGSLWHIELLPRDGRAVPFVTSVWGDRRAAFEHAAALAKAVSAITALPVQVCVAGNVWTPGWPPKASVVSRS